MSSRGFSLVETLVVAAVLAIAVAVGFPFFRACAAEAHLLGAGQAFRSEFRKARSLAVRSTASTPRSASSAGSEGASYAVYVDGNGNGVRSADIRSGVDRLLAGPFPLTGGAPGVRVGFNPGTPAVPPARGALDGDPIRFGRSDILSFSPAGNRHPRDLLPGRGRAQAAVRVTGQRPGAADDLARLLEGAVRRGVPPFPSSASSRRTGPEASARRPGAAPPVGADRRDGSPRPPSRSGGGCAVPAGETLDGGRVLVWWPGRPARAASIACGRGSDRWAGRPRPASRFTPGPSRAGLAADSAVRPGLC